MKRRIHALLQSEDQDRELDAPLTSEGAGTARTKADPLTPEIEATHRRARRDPDPYAEAAKTPILPSEASNDHKEA